MKRFAFSLLVMIAAACTALANAPTASEMMAKAQAEAKATKKTVLVKFEASWCGWCKEFDKFLADPAMGKLMNDNFVIVHMVVQESDKNKALENEGGDAMLKEWGGEGSGIPYLVVLDDKGKMLANSMELKADGTKVGNTGYPAADHEIAWFIKMLKTVPSMKDAQRAQIQKWLTEHAPKH
jgi:thioredoxin-related protein